MFGISLDHLKDNANIWQEVGLKMIGEGEKNLNLYRKKFQSLCESSEGVAEVYGGLEISQRNFSLVVTLTMIAATNLDTASYFLEMGQCWIWSRMFKATRL